MSRLLANFVILAALIAIFAPRCALCQDEEQPTTTANPSTLIQEDPEFISTGTGGEVPPPEEDPTPAPPPPTVQVAAPHGPVVGNVEHAGTAGQFYTFKGIPYAEPPIGEHRFKDPRLKQAWSEPRNALEYGEVCTQPSFQLGQKFRGSEDCLFLNIFTPKVKLKGTHLSRKDLLPVFVYIHGGGFTVGSGSDSPGDLFMGRDVVYVSINYRLGPFGFLTIGNRYISGNMGLKDQVMALRWISQNIHAFGGDNTKVSIAGESAGGMSVTLQQVSPQGKGLYRNIIAMSGSSLYRPYSYINNAPLAEGHRYVAAVGCSRSQLQETLNCLEEKDVDDLFVEYESLSFVQGLEKNLDRSGDYKWLPTTDPYAATPFLPESPLQILSKGAQKDLPVIIGVVENEGGIYAPVFDYEASGLNANWSYHGPMLMFDIDAKDVTPQQQLVANITRQFYNGVSLNFTLENQFGLYDFVSDGFFTSNAYQNARFLANSQKSPVYFYQITGDSSFSSGTLFFGQPTDQDVGLTHAGDLFFIFKTVYGISGTETEEAQKTSEQILSYWTNFAKHGNTPSPDDSGAPRWKNWGSNEDYLEIKPEPEMKQGFEPVRMHFWDKLYWEPIVKAGIFLPDTANPYLIVQSS